MKGTTISRLAMEGVSSNLIFSKVEPWTYLRQILTGSYPLAPSINDAARVLLRWADRSMYLDARSKKEQGMRVRWCVPGESKNAFGRQSSARREDFQLNHLAEHEIQKVDLMQPNEMSRRRFMTMASATYLSSVLVPGIPAQIVQDHPSIAPNDGTQYQAKAPATQAFGGKAFGPSKVTTARWLGAGGLFLNSRGTTMMLDPLLEDFHMSMIIQMPILPQDVAHLDALLVTHSDSDHYSVSTCRDLLSACKSYHSTQYVASLMNQEGFPASGHNIGETFPIGTIRITLTPADHAWQNAHPRPGQRHFDDSDACGFRFETADGTIWAPGDTRLMDIHLHQPTPDALFMDFSEDKWHFTLAGAAKLANAYPETPILLSHWGTIDAPNFPPFNGDPSKFRALLVNPGRMKVLAPGQPYILRGLKKA